MRIAILGTGSVAQSLAAGWARHGHTVRLASRSPDAKPELAGYAPGSYDDVLPETDLVVIALPGQASPDVARDIATLLGGKIVVDASNAVTRDGGILRSALAPDDSVGEQVQRAAPEARVVKAYNTVGQELMVDPGLPGGPPTMFIAGDDSDANGEVRRLLESTGWDVVDVGGIVASRQLEQLAALWIGLAITTGNRTQAFKLLRQQ